MKKILITSALPYANGPIHVGHLVEYIQTDIYSRFQKLIGNHAIYCCADDTHGAPIEINAKKQGIAPEQLIAKYYKEHQEDFKSFHINFDSYYSTNSPESKHFSDQIFLECQKKGLIYTKEVEQTYCETCKRFLPDRYVRGICPKCKAVDQYGDVCEKCNSIHKTTDLIEPKCSVCQKTPIRKSSKHYFFKLSEFSEKLKHYLSNNKELQPEVKNHVLAWIQAGLEDWDISRDGPYFGFKIPGEEDKYYYVWLDAPIGYIASTQNYCNHHKEESEKLEDYWKHGEIIHFIGKDIMYFHLLFWPAILMATDYALPKNIVVHGFLTVNGEKMSKSRGTFLTAKDYLKISKPEFLRFYYAANLSRTTTDIDLSLKDLEGKTNTELVSNIANFIYRVLSFTNKNFNSEITTISENPNTKDKEFTHQLEKEFEEVKNLYEKIEFRETVKKILYISTLGNKYFQEREPWKTIKENKEETQKTITLSVNLVKNLAIALKPILPEFTEKIEGQLNLHSLTWNDINFTLENHTINQAEIILTKQEIKQPDSPFSILNLKVAQITEVKDHPNAEKLYILKIDLGNEERQLVAGLKAHYTKEELLGRKIVVITNLKPAKLKGELSQGMLLAGEKDNIVGTLLPKKSNPGDQVTIEGLTYSDAQQPKEISIDDFVKLNLQVKDGKAEWEGKILKTEKEDIHVDRIKEGRIC